MSAWNQPGTGRRQWRRLGGLVAAITFIGLGFGLLASPANATDGSTGSLDTSTTTVTTQPGAATERGKGSYGEPECDGNKCKKINWCDGRGGNPHPDNPSDDAPVVILKKGGDGYGEPACIKKPKIDYKCCEVGSDGMTHVAITVTNRAEYDFKIKLQVDDQSVVEWVKAGTAKVFRFKGITDGKHKVHAAVWAGKGSWCSFPAKDIFVQCEVPTPPTTVPTTTPVTHSPPPTPTKTSKSPTAAVTTTPASDDQLPVTGPPVGMIVTFSGLLLGGGVLVLLAMRRRRAQRFVA